MCFGSTGCTPTSSESRAYGSCTRLPINSLPMLHCFSSFFRLISRRLILITTIPYPIPVESTLVSVLGMSTLAGFAACYFNLRCKHGRRAAVNPTLGDVNAKCTTTESGQQRFLRYREDRTSISGSLVECLSPAWSRVNLVGQKKSYGT